MKFLLLFSLLGEVDSLFWEPLDSLISKGLEYTYSEKYQEATFYFDLAIKNYPSSPIGYLYKAGLLDLYMIDFETDIYEKIFYELLDKAVELSRKIRDRANSDSELVAWSYFAEGSAFAYRAIRKGRNKEYIPAIQYGLESIDLLRKCIEIDSTIYDAYLPLGVFEFAMTKVPSALRWLLPGDYSKEEALKKIELSALKSKYIQVIAMNAYVWVLAYDNQNDSALKVAERLVEMYPTSRTFRWTLSYVQRRMGLWKEALKNHEVILYLTLRDQPWNSYNVAISLYYLAICSYIVGEKRRALFYAEACKNELLKVTEDRPLKGRILKVVSNLSERLERYRGTNLYVDPAGVEKYVP
jgi:tetratricopeptide (TPR) repeat protein